VWRHGPESRVTRSVQEWMREQIRGQPDLTLRELRQRLEETKHVSLSIGRIWLALLRFPQGAYRRCFGSGSGRGPHYDHPSRTQLPGSGIAAVVYGNHENALGWAVADIRPWSVVGPYHAARTFQRYSRTGKAVVALEQGAACAGGSDLKVISSTKNASGKTKT
jgi:hypothetical protein